MVLAGKAFFFPERIMAPPTIVALTFRILPLSARNCVFLASADGPGSLRWRATPPIAMVIALWSSPTRARARGSRFGLGAGN